MTEMRVHLFSERTPRLPHAYPDPLGADTTFVLTRREGAGFVLKCMPALYIQLHISRTTSCVTCGAGARSTSTQDRPVSVLCGYASSGRGHDPGTGRTLKLQQRMVLPFHSSNKSDSDSDLNTLWRLTGYRTYPIA